VIILVSSAKKMPLAPSSAATPALVVTVLQCRFGRNMPFKSNQSRGQRPQTTARGAALLVLLLACVLACVLA